MAAAIDSGQLTGRAAFDELVEASMSPDLSAADRADLRDMLSELAAVDPHLQQLLARLS